MGIFNRKPQRQDSSTSNSADDSSSEHKKEKNGWKRPASQSQFTPTNSTNSHLSIDTAFKQQRLKAWQPILTPKTVLPTLFIIAVLFAPIGGLLIWGSSLVSELTLDYTNCEKLTPATDPADLTFTNIPSSKYSYHFRSKDSKAASNPTAPRYAFLDNTNNSTVTDISEQLQCVIEFQVPADMQPSVLFYYKLSNFYQNHRRYVKSLNSDQLKGKSVKASDLKDGDCKPLALDSNHIPIYPCGLVANSLFNGTSHSHSRLATHVNHITPSRYILLPRTPQPQLRRCIHHLRLLIKRHSMARRIQEIRRSPSRN